MHEMRNKRTMLLNCFLVCCLLTGGTGLAIPIHSKALMSFGLMFSPGASFFLQPGYQNQIGQKSFGPKLMRPSSFPMAITQRKPSLPLYSLSEQNFDNFNHCLDIPGEHLQEEFLKHASSQGVKSEYSLKTLEEVDALRFKSLDFTGLLDLTHYHFTTMDNDHSKDLDQAFYISYDGVAKTYRVYYAIADASYFSVPGTSIDKEASERVFTTYLPGFDIPVFPRLISEKLCSLVPEKKRRAVVIIMDFSIDGVMLAKRFAHAAIQSRAQLSFRRVQEYYNQMETHPFANKQYRQSLDHLYTLGEALVHKAKERGVVDFGFKELSIRPDDKQNIYEISDNTRYRVEKYNEQISVAANQAVAEYFIENSLYYIKRFHPSTSNERLDLARKKLKQLEMPWSYCDSMRVFVESLQGTPLHQHIAKSIACRSNLRAKYTGQHNKRGHEGLKISSYAHFTAPMRRYTDIVNHRILLAHLKGQNVPYQSNSKQLPRYLRQGFLERYAGKANRAREREEQIRSNIYDYVSSLLLLPVKDEILTATIVYVNKGGISIRIDKHPFDRWLSASTLPNKELTGVFTEGQSIAVELEETMIDGHWYLSPQYLF